MIIEVENIVSGFSNKTFINNLAKSILKCVQPTGQKEKFPEADITLSGKRRKES